jgi:serpin B
MEHVGKNMKLGNQEASMNRNIERIIKLAGKPEVATLGLTGLVLAALAAGCAAPAESNTVQSDKERVAAAAPQAETDQLVAGNSAFAFDLYQALRDGEGNLFFSPYSVSLALAMTHAGARAETEQQMADTLHYTLPQSQLHPTFNALDTTLSSAGQADGAGEPEDAFQLNIANAIWGQEGFEFLPEFLDTLAENYGAGLRTLDFGSDPEEARTTINNWVSEETEEKIKDLIAQGALGNDTRLVLTNAIYFNGKWLLQFDPGLTFDDRFNLLDGDGVLVPMMGQEENFGYGEGDGYQAVALPYQGANMSMIFVLPELERFEEVEAALSADFLSDVIDGLDVQRVDLTVPKFTFESEFGLARTLADMGMADAFGEAADFSGMTGKRDLFISDVVHKAFVAVDEEGTEAAAATAVIMAEMAAMPQEAVEMRLDHPFLFFIRDDDSGTILFAGRVLNPEG